MYGQITINVEGEKSKSYPIKNTETYIGRDRVCEIRLDHPDVALRHCLIIVSEGGFPATVHNLCEITPALLNGRLIFPSDSQLKNGDIITIGPRKLEWSYNKRCLPSTWSDGKGASCSVKRTRSSEPVHKQRLVAIVSPHRNDERDLPPKKRRKTMFTNLPSSSSSSSASSSLSASTSSTNSNYHHHRSPHHHLVHNHHHLQELNYSSVLDFSRRNIDSSSRPNDSAVRNSPLNRTNYSHNSSGISNQSITSRIPLRLGQSRGRTVTSSSQGTLRPPRVNCGVPSTSRTNRPVQNQVIQPSTSRLLPAASLQRDHGRPNTSANSSSIPRARILKIRTPHKISIINDIAISVQPIDLRAFKKETEGAKSIPYFYLDKSRCGNSSTASTSDGRHVQPSTSNESNHSRKPPTYNVKKGKSKRSVTDNRPSQANTSTSSSNSSRKIQKIRTDTRKIPFYIMKRKRGRTPLDSELYSDSEEEKPNLSNASQKDSKKPVCIDTEQGTSEQSVTEVSTENREPLHNAPGTSSNETNNNSQRIESDTRKIPFYYMRRKIVNSSDVESFSDDSSDEDVSPVKNNNNTETPNKSQNIGTSVKTESPETYHTPQNGINRKTNSSTDKSKKKSSSTTAKRHSSAVKKPHLRLKSSKTSNSLRIELDNSSAQSSYITTKSPDSTVSGSMPATPNHTENTNTLLMPVTPPNDGKYQILMRSSKRESFRRKILKRSLAENSFTLQNNSVSPVERNSVKFNASAMNNNNSTPRPTTPPNVCSPKIVMRSSKKESLKKLSLDKSNNPNDTPSVSKHSLNPKLSLEFSAQIFKKLKDKSSEFENLLDSPLTRSKLLMSFDSSKSSSSSRGSQLKSFENLPSTSTDKMHLPSCSSNNSINDKFPEERKIKISFKTNNVEKTLSKSVEIPSTSKDIIHRVCKSFNEKFESSQRKSRPHSKEKLSRISNGNLNDSVRTCLKDHSSKESISNVSKVSKKSSRFIENNVRNSDGAHISHEYSNSSNKSALNSSRVSSMESNSSSWRMKTSRKSSFKSPKSHKNKRTQVNIGANKIITSTPRTNVDRTPLRIVWDLLAEVDSNTPSDSVYSSPQGKDRSQRRNINESDVSTANASMLCDNSKTSVKKLHWDDEVSSSKDGNSSRNSAHCSNRYDVHSGISSVSCNRSERAINLIEAPKETVVQTMKSASFCTVHSPKKDHSPHPGRSNSLSALNFQEKNNKSPGHSKESASLSLMNSPNEEQSPLSRSGSIAVMNLKENDETPRSRRSYSLAALNSQIKDETQRSNKRDSLAPANSLEKVETPGQSNSSASVSSGDSMKKTTRSKKSNSLSAPKSLIAGGADTTLNTVMNITIPSVGSQRKSNTPHLRNMKSPAEVETPRQPRNNISLSSVNLLKEEITPRRSLRSNNSSIVKKSLKVENTPISKQTPHPSASSKKKSETLQLEKSQIDTPTTSQNNASNPGKIIRKSSSDPAISLPIKNTRKLLSKSTVELSKSKKETPFRLTRSKSISQISVVKNVSNKNNTEVKADKNKVSLVNTRRSSTPKKENDPKTSIELTDKTKISKTPVKLKTPASAKAGSSDKKIRSNQSAKKSPPKRCNIKVDFHRNCVSAVKNVPKPKVPRTRTLSHQSGAFKIASTSKKPIKTSMTKNVQDKTRRRSLPKVQTAKKNKSLETKRNSLPLKLPTIKTPKIVAKKPIKSPRVSSKITISKLKSSTPTSSKKSVITPASSKRSITTPSTAKKSVITPASLKKSVITPTSLKKSVITPSTSKKRVITPTSSKKSVLTPTSSKKSVNTPTSSKKSVNTPTSSRKRVTTPKNTVLLNPLKSRHSTKNNLKSSPTSTPKSAFPTRRKALTTIRKPLKLGDTVLKRKLDALCLEKSRAAAKKLKAEPAKSLDKKKVAALLMCHKKKSPMKESNSGSSAIASISSEKSPMKTPIKNTTTPKIKKLCFVGVNEATPSNAAIINRQKTPAKKRTTSEDVNTTVDSLPENYLKQEETFQEDDIFSALYLSRKTSTPAQEVEKPLRRLRSTVNKMKISNSSHSTINSSSKKHVFFATPIAADFADVKAECSTSTTPNVSCLKRTIDPFVSKDFLDESDGKESLNVLSTSTDADYGNVSGVKNIMHLSPQADYTNVSGMKKVLNLSPQPDYSNVSCLKRNLELSPQPDYTDVVGVKNLLELKPIPDYSNVSCMKRVFTTSPVANYTDVTGVKQIFTVPPTADYVNTRGLKELRPASEYLNISGVRELFKEPQQVAAEGKEEKVETVTAASEEAGPSTSSGARKLRKRKPNKETEESVPAQQLRSRQVKTVQKKTTEKLPAEENENKHTSSAVDNNYESDPSTNTVSRNLRRGRSANRVTPNEVISSVVPSTSGEGKQAETGAKKEGYSATKQEPKATVDEKSTGKSRRKKANHDVEIIDLNNQAESAVASVSIKPTRRNTRSQQSQESKVNVKKSAGKASRKTANSQVENINLNNQAEHAVASVSEKPTQKNTRSQLSSESKINVENSSEKPKKKRTNPDKQLIELNNQAELDVPSVSGKSTRKNTRSRPSNESKVLVEKPSRKRVKRQEESTDLNNQSIPEVVSKKSKVTRQTETAEETVTRKTTRTKVVKTKPPKTGKRASITSINKSRARLVSSQKEEAVNLKNQVEPSSVPAASTAVKNRRSKKSKLNNETKTSVQETTSTKKTRSKVAAKAEPKIKRRSSANKSGLKLVSSLRGSKATHNAKKKTVRFDRSYSKPSTNKSARKK